MAIKLSSGKLNQIASSLLLVPFHPVLNFLHCPGHLGQQLSTRRGDHDVILNSDLDNHIAVSHRLGCAVEQDMLYSWNIVLYTLSPWKLEIELKPLQDRTEPLTPPNPLNLCKTSLLKKQACLGSARA